MGSWELDLRSARDAVVRRASTGSSASRRPTPPNRSRRSSGTCIPTIVSAWSACSPTRSQRPEAVPERGIEHTVRLIRDDGSVREMRAVGRLERDARGPARWVGAIQDVTEQRLTERELHAPLRRQSGRCASGSPSSTASSTSCAGSRPRWTTRWRALWLWDASVDALGCRAFWTAPGVDPGDCEEIIRGDPLRRRGGQAGARLADPRAGRSPPTSPADTAFALRDAALARGMALGDRLPRRRPGRAGRGAVVLRLRAPRAESGARAHADRDRRASWGAS